MVIDAAPPRHRVRPVRSRAGQCRLIGVSRALLIEDAPPPASAFVARRGGRAPSASIRMSVTRPAAPARSVARRGLAAHRARGPADVEDIVTVQVGAFHDSADEVRDMVLAGLAGAGERFYIARLGGEPVGSLKVYTPEGRAGVYAFGVAPQHRRRGFGRQILLRVMAELGAEGHTRIWLEVDRAMPRPSRSTAPSHSPSPPPTATSPSRSDRVIWPVPRDVLRAGLFIRL